MPNKVIVDGFCPLATEMFLPCKGGTCSSRNCSILFEYPFRTVFVTVVTEVAKSASGSLKTVAPITQPDRYVLLAAWKSRKDSNLFMSRQEQDKFKHATEHTRIIRIPHKCHNFFIVNFVTLVSQVGLCGGTPAHRIWYRLHLIDPSPVDQVLYAQWWQHTSHFKDCWSHQVLDRSLIKKKTRGV